MLNDVLIEQLLDYGEGRGLDYVWAWAEKEGNTFEARREAFLWILRRLLESGRVKLHKDGKVLEGTTDEWVRLFDEKMPRTEIPYPRRPGMDFDFGYEQWFFDPDCPGQAVWIDQDTGQACLTW